MFAARLIGRNLAEMLLTQLEQATSARESSTQKNPGFEAEELKAFSCELFPKKLCDKTKAMLCKRQNYTPASQSRR